MLVSGVPPGGVPQVGCLVKAPQSPRCTTAAWFSRETVRVSLRFARTAISGRPHPVTAGASVFDATERMARALAELECFHGASAPLDDDVTLVMLQRG